MKKFLAVVLCVFMMFALVACNGDGNSNKNDNNQNTTENKIQLTTSNYTQYIDVRRTINVDEFVIKNISGVYFVEGKATLTLEVYQKQPVKCYGVEIEFAKKDPYDNLGIELSLEENPVLLVPANGAMVKEFDIKIATGDMNVLGQQIVSYRRTREQMIDSIEEPFNFSMMTKLVNVSGYVVLE